MRRHVYVCVVCQMSISTASVQRRGRLLHRASTKQWVRQATLFQDRNLDRNSAAFKGG
jgi:hypothetical protein